MTRLRRLVKYLALGVAALVVLGLTGVGILYARLPSDDVDPVEVGGLLVADTAQGTHPIGTASLSISGDTVRIERSGRVIWSSDPGHAFVTAADGRVDVEEHRGYFWPSVDRDRVWTDQTIEEVTPTGDGVTVTGHLLADWNETAYYEVDVVDTDGKLTLEVAAPDMDSVALHSGRSLHAGVHGFGAQFTDFDLDGRVLPLLVREQGVGRGLQPLTFLANLTNNGAGGNDTMTYAAWPSFVTEDLRGLRVAPMSPGSHSFAVADMTTPDRIGLELWHPSLTVELSVGDNPSDLVVAQHAEDARTPLPAWTQEGLIVGLQGGEQAVRERVDRLQDAGVDLAGVWIQDWVGQRSTSFGDRLWWTWQLDRERYPDWEGLVDELSGDGIRVTTYVNPFVSDAALKNDPEIRNLYVEAREAGYLVRNSDGQPYELDQGGYTAYLVDLTNAEAQGWFIDVIADEVLGIGVDGFMADFAEGLPFDAELDLGTGRELHNAWPRLWMETVAEACGIARKPDCVSWFRSGSLGHSPALAWTGDQLVDFGREDGLASALLGTFSSGVSGWPVVHSDLGGYTSIDAVVKDYTRSPELLKRWAEFAAFGPVMRSHETNRPADNLQPDQDPDVAAHLADMTAVFTALTDYRAAVLEDAVDSGLPAIRHGWLVAPGTEAAEVDTQFFLGDDVLVAPVMTEDADTVSVTFPPGQWRHLFTGEVVEGEQTITVPAPLGQPAAYVSDSSDWADRLVADVGESTPDSDLPN